MGNILKTPYPYFGGKSRIAALIWSRLGDVANYVEPFFGSGAVLLRRPHAPRIETINDVDGMVCNFWRSIKADPAAVAEWADHPVIEQDLHAIHRWLVLGEEAAEFRRRMKVDPDFYDAKRAGRWAYGACCWIGGGWCSPHGETVDGDRQQRRPHIGTAGIGTARILPSRATPAGLDKRPKLSGGAPDSGALGTGVHANGPAEKLPRLTGGRRDGDEYYGGMMVHQDRVPDKMPLPPRPTGNHDGGNSRGVHAEKGPSDGHRPQLADAYSLGRGVHAGPTLSQQVPLLGAYHGQVAGPGVLNPAGGGTCAARRAWLVEWFSRLADRLRTVRVCCGHWLRVCDSDSTTVRLGTTGVFCMHPDTLVRTTDEREVRVADLRIGEQIAPGRCVIEKFMRQHRGEMLTIRVQGLPSPLRLTPEHRVMAIPGRVSGRQDSRGDEALWGLRALKPVGALEVGDYLLVPLGGWSGEVAWQYRTASRPRGVLRPSRFDPSAALYRVIGYYAAEGNLQFKGPSRPHQVVWTFGTHEVETHIADLVACLESVFGFTPSVKRHYDTGAMKVRMGSAALAEFFANYVPGTATVKRLHPDLMAAPPEYQAQILKAWLRGDGGVDVGSRNRFKLMGTSASETLARQMFTIAVRSGLRPAFKRRRANFDVYFASEDAARLGWSPPAVKFRSSRRIIEGHSLARVRSIDSEPYDGPVYDIDVDGDDLFAAPYVLIHNCDPPYSHDVARMLAWVAHLDGTGPEPPKAGASTNRAKDLYANDRAQDVDRLVAEVHRYCRDRGPDPRMRIALCGYAGEHDALESLGWECVAWTAAGGYGNRKKANVNRERERLWVSPHCLGRGTDPARDLPGQMMMPFPTTEDSP